MSLAAEMPEVLGWNENAAECLQLLCQWESKTDVFECERMEVWDNLGGFSAETTAENCFMMFRAWGLYMQVCAHCMHACARVCVCADMSWGRWLISANVHLCPQHESPLCSLRPDSFQRPELQQSRSLNPLTSAPFNELIESDSSSSTARAIVAISNCGKTINNTVQNVFSLLFPNYYSCYEEAVEHLPHSHQTNGASLQVQRAQAAWSHR